MAIPGIGGKSRGRKLSSSEKAAKLAVKVAKRKGLALLAAGLFSTTGLVLLILVVSLFGAVVAFSGDDEGTGATEQMSCDSAGTPGPVSDLHLRSVNGATAAGLNAAQTSNAAVIMQVAWAKGLGDEGARIGVSVALGEATLLNYANDGTSTLHAVGRQLTDADKALAAQSMNYPHDAVGNNLDSIGLFQQRPSTGWGTPAELINPQVSAGKFFDALVGQVPFWRTMSPWVAAQTVQGSPSSDGGIYRVQWSQTEAIVTAIKPLINAGAVGNNSPGSGTTAPSTPPSGTPSSTPTSTAASTPADQLVDAPRGGNGGCQTPPNAGGGGGTVAGAPVVFNGNMTINAPSGSYTIKLPEGPRGKLLQAIATKMGTDYVWGAAGPDVFDCSGLISWGLGQAGVGVGRLTADEFWQQMPHITPGTEQAGDIVLFNARFGPGSNQAGHIGVVIDPAQHLMMHTYDTGKPATVSHYDTWEAGGPLGFAQVIAATGGSTPEKDQSKGSGVLVAAGG